MGWEGARALQLKACPWLAALSWRATLGYASMAKVDQMAVEAKVMEVTANAVVYLRFRMDSLHSRSSTTAGRAWQSLADAASFLGQRLPACLSAPVPRDGRLVMCSGWQGPCPCAAVAVLHAIQRGAAVVWKHSSADQAFEESPRCERRPAGGGGGVAAVARTVFGCFLLHGVVHSCILGHPNPLRCFSDPACFRQPPWRWIDAPKT